MSGGLGDITRLHYAALGPYCMSLHPDTGSPITEAVAAQEGPRMEKRRAEELWSSLENQVPSLGLEKKSVT